MSSKLSKIRNCVMSKPDKHKDRYDLYFRDETFDPNSVEISEKAKGKLFEQFTAEAKADADDLSDDLVFTCLCGQCSKPITSKDIYNMLAAGTYNEHEFIRELIEDHINRNKYEAYKKNITVDELIASRG